MANYKKKSLLGLAPVGYTAEKRCKNEHDEAGKGICDPKPECGFDCILRCAPVFLEEDREKASHHNGCKAGVGPVVHGPGEYLAVFALPVLFKYPFIRYHNYSSLIQQHKFYHEELVCLTVFLRELKPFF
jgi:hypothetical protein